MNIPRKSLCTDGGCSRPGEYYEYGGRGWLCLHHATIGSAIQERYGNRKPRKKGQYENLHHKYPGLAKTLRLYLKHNIRCERHEQAGKIVAATEVDHIFSIRLYESNPQMIPYEDPVYDWNNLQSLCSKCHSYKSGQERKGVFMDFKRQKKYLIES